MYLFQNIIIIIHRTWKSRLLVHLCFRVINHTFNSPSDHFPVVSLLNITPPKPSPLTKHLLHSMMSINIQSFIQDIFHQRTSRILFLIFLVWLTVIILPCPCLLFSTSMHVLKQKSYVSNLVILASRWL